MGKMTFPVKDGTLNANTENDDWKPPDHEIEIYDWDNSEFKAITAADNPAAILAEAEQAPPADPEPPKEDWWERVGHYLVRHHEVPLTKYYVPKREDCLTVSIKHLDVMRKTVTDLHEFQQLREIKDCWTGHYSDTKPLLTHNGQDVQWTGAAWFEIIAPLKTQKPKQEWVDGWIVNKKAGTDRPCNIASATWHQTSPPAKKRLIEVANKEMDDIRRARGLREIPWIPVPLEHCEDFGFQTKPMAFGARETALTSEDVPLCGECCAEEESEEDLVCSTCFKMCSHIQKNGEPHQ